MALALAVTLEPERLAARLELTGISVGADSYTITRTAPSGNEAGVRGATDRFPTGATVIVRDYELPLNTPLTYTATVTDEGILVGTATADFEVIWGDCECWLVDLAQPTNSVALVVESMTELAYQAAAGVHRILNRRAPVLTTLVAWTPSTELVLLTDTLEERDTVRNMLGTGYPFLLRTIPEQGIGNMYLGATEFVEERFIALGTAPQRRFRVACTQVERPDPAIYVPTAPNTYDKVKATYPTYADLSGGPINVLTNPGFETNTTGWLATPTATIARDTAEHYSGVASLKVTANSGGNQGVQIWPWYRSASVVPGSKWSVTARLKAPAGTVIRVGIYAYNDVPTYLSGVIATETGTGAWQSLTRVFTALPAGTTQLNIQFDTNVLATPFYIDDVVLWTETTPTTSYDELAYAWPEDPTGAPTVPWLPDDV